jgi:hypothetical protein
VLNICVALLLVAYTGCGVRSSARWSCTTDDDAAALPSQRGGGRSLLADRLVPLRPQSSRTCSWRRACGRQRQRPMQSSSPSLTATYMFVWKLFYAEYCLLPLFGR